MDLHIPSGIHPFWFWNGDITETEVRFQIREMADKGIKGFFIHSRQGLKRPYLSDSFFDMVSAAIDEAEKQGLCVHLYDEYPYPSGVAGGEAVAGRPEYYAFRLMQQRHNAQGGYTRIALPEGRILQCSAFPLRDGTPAWENGLDLKDAVGMVLGDYSYNEMGLTQYNRKRFFAGRPIPVLETELPEGEWEIFVSVQSVVTHFKYWSHYLDTLNKDAVSHYIELTHQRYKDRFGDKFGSVVKSIFTDETQPWWSPVLLDAFKDEYGYSLEENLFVLQEPEHPDHLKLLADFRRLEYRLFCETYDGPIQKWCEEAGIAYTGEKPSLRLAQLKYMHIPGCEPGHIKAGARMDVVKPKIRQNARATASAAYFYGKPNSLVECYHSTGWSATLQDAKLVGEGLLLAGIDMLVPHGFFYTTHGLAKHDAPPTFFFQMPFWKYFSFFSDRVEAITGYFKDTHIDASILVVDPESGFPGRDEYEVYGEFLTMLNENRFDYLIADTDILSSGDIKNSILQVRDIKARLIVLPPMKVVEPELEKLLDVFEQKGIAVLRLEGNPGLEQKDILLQTAPPSLRVSAEKGDLSRLWSVKRTDGEKDLWFVLNTGPETIEADFSTEEGELHELSLDPSVPRQLKNGRRTLAPFESVCIEKTDNPELPAEYGNMTVPVAGECGFRLLNENLLRMYEWDMRVEDETKRVRCVPVANQLQEGGFRYVPNTHAYFGHQPELEYPEMDIVYTHTFRCEYEGTVSLVIEPESIAGTWTLSVNGNRELTEQDFAETDAHVRGSLGTDVTAFLEKGENSIELRVRVYRHDHGLRNPLYLAGDFGVELGDIPVLVALNDTGGFETYSGNLLPYFSGEIEYALDVDLENVPEGETLVRFDMGEYFHEACEVSLNGSPFRPLLWEPRVLGYPEGSLKNGTNRLLVRVATTLIRSFEGQYFDYKEHCYKNVNE